MKHKSTIALLLLLAVNASADEAETPPYTIGFASFAPLSSDIFIADGDGRNARALLPDSNLDQNASFSEDGKWIVFSSRRDGSTDIYRVHADGSDLERLIDHPAYDDQGALSPDGNYLAFVSTRSGHADIWILELNTKKLQQLTDDRGGDFRPAWSPDGEWIAFSSDRDSNQPRNGFGLRQSTEIYVMRADGSDLTRLTSRQEIAGSPSWSADGKQLVFYQSQMQQYGKLKSPNPAVNGTTQIAAIDIATRDFRILTSGDSKKFSPKWLQDDRLAFVAIGNDGGIEFLHGAAGERGKYQSPSWTADGRRMVFHRFVDSGWPPLQKWHSGDPQFRLLRTGIFPSFSPRTDRLVVNDREAGAAKNGIVTMNPDGSQRSTLYSHETLNALQPVWSPQGDRIAFALGEFFQKRGSVPAVADIALMHSDGSEMRRLTLSDGNYGFPSWSPDGRQLVYRSFSHTTGGLYIMNVENGESKQLTLGPDNFPAWSPAGDSIAFTSNRDGAYQIYTINPDGTGLKPLTDEPGNDAHLAWSPDGEWIAFSSERGGFKDESVLYRWNPQPYGDIFVMRKDGTDVRQLTDDQFEEATPGWMPLILDRK